MAAIETIRLTTYGCGLGADDLTPHEARTDGGRPNINTGIAHRSDRLLLARENGRYEANAKAPGQRAE